MTPHFVIQAIFMCTGLVSLAASVFNWEWFFTTRNLLYIVQRFGRTKARVFYGMVGVVFILSAIYFFTVTIQYGAGR